MSNWTDSLQQASFRGVPFAVLGGDGAHGRRTAVHEYPFKDKPWVEDLGRGVRQFRLTGFLITDSAIYGGGDVLAQRERLVAACEQEGSGTLVHPTLGELTVSVPAGSLTVTERWDTGRYFEIGLVVIESGDREFPSNDADTGEATDDAADEVDDAAESDYADAVTGDAEFYTGITDALSYGSAVVGMVVSAAQDWIGMVLFAAGDATSLINMVVELPGNFGRFFAGALSGFLGGAQPIAGATVASLITAGIAKRALVAAACDDLATASGNTDPSATASTARAVAVALGNSCANPADAVRLLTSVAAFYPATNVEPGIIGTAQTVVRDATGALFRRAAITALARATTTYMPASADEAAALRDQVAAVIQGEIDVAGDAGDDASYGAMRALRAAVITDLNIRGAALPQLQTVETRATMPALVLAQQLYQDAGRADELVLEADPVHPAFMPLSFQALSR